VARSDGCYISKIRLGNGVLPIAADDDDEDFPETELDLPDELDERALDPDGAYMLNAL
jgi:hypothetical protein